MKNIKIALGRLAPSPTGFLHLGNAWSFLLAWANARSQSGRIILRIDDIDQTRSRHTYVVALIEDLQWLGLDWDLGPTLANFDPHYFQSKRQAIYEKVLAELTKQQLTYPCFCTRKELKTLASAPHLEDSGLFYPGSCRNLSLNERANKIAAGQKAAIRLKCPLDLGTINFNDKYMGQQSFTPTPQNCDLPLRRSDGVIAYQLASVIDDALMNVTQVLRGRDLLSSTPRQILLTQMIGLGTIPEYAHIPLILDEYGQRLAKRHQSLTLRSLRESGAKPEQIIALLAFLAGINDTKQNLTAKEFLPRFGSATLNGHDLMITPTLLATFGLPI